MNSVYELIAVFAAVGVAWLPRAFPGNAQKPSRSKKATPAHPAGGPAMDL
jgi:hypothetical protein